VGQFLVAKVGHFLVAVDTRLARTEGLLARKPKSFGFDLADAFVRNPRRATKLSVADSRRLV
jgi:hypothetical protein